MCNDRLFAQECCGCCSLGLQLRSEGHRCEAHRYMGFQCRHAFLNCCKGDEERTENEDVWHTVRHQTPTSPPKKGTVNKYAQT